MPADQAIEGDFALPFLGQREYLHGTTLFDLLLERVPSHPSVTFKIASIIRSDRIRVRSASGASGASKPAASLKWATPGREGLLEVFPLPAGSMPVRVPYDEELITKRARIDSSGVHFEGPAPFSFIATLVPLFKELLRVRKLAGSAGQWMFTRLDMDDVPTDAFFPLLLELDRQSSSAMARCAFQAGRKYAGQIYFSWVGSA
jgi:hypothetical protein